MYREMKDSGVEWIGQMPSSWQVKQLSQLVSQVKNKNCDLREQNLLSLSYGNINQKSIETTYGLLPASFDGYNIIAKGDIVMRLTDLQNDHTSLRVGRATEHGIITSAYTTVRPTKETSQFLYLALYSFDVKKGFYGMGAGVRQGLNYSESTRVLLPVPPLPEQTAIAEYLDDRCAAIDEIIAEAKATIEEYKAWKASDIFEAVTKGLDPNAEMKDSGIEWIGEVPRHWSVAKQKYFITLINGRAYADNEFVTEGKYRVLRVGNFFTNTSWYYSDLDLTPDKYCDSGDLLYAWSASYGPKIWDGGKVIYHYHIWKCKLSQRVDKMFSYYYFLALGQFVANSAHGTAMMHITMQMMNNAFMPIPPLHEQLSIVSYLDRKCAAIDEIIAEKEALIADMESYKKSLIFETVTGKRRVV